MRLDKYLKVARILKRRVIAKELAENDRLFVNDRLAKASTEVKIGDTIKIIFGQRIIVIRVLGISEIVNKQEACSLYEVIEERKIDEV